jgi:hypothetical protein
MRNETCHREKVLSNKKPHRDLFLDRGAGWGSDMEFPTTNIRGLQNLDGAFYVAAPGILLESPKWSEGGNL